MAKCEVLSAEKQKHSDLYARRCSERERGSYRSHRHVEKERESERDRDRGRERLRGWGGGGAGRERERERERERVSTEQDRQTDRKNSNRERLHIVDQYNHDFCIQTNPLDPGHFTNLLYFLCCLL